MTEEELLTRERYPYEVARYLGISMRRMRDMCRMAKFYKDFNSKYRKLPVSVVKRILEIYNSL